MNVSPILFYTPDGNYWLNNGDEVECQKLDEIELVINNRAASRIIHTADKLLKWIIFINSDSCIKVYTIKKHRGTLYYAYTNNRSRLWYYKYRSKAIERFLQQGNSICKRGDEKNEKHLMAN
jgi:hypothetical protein